MVGNNRGKKTIRVPKWILNKKQFIVEFLKGLYEAEGSLCVHKPTYTYKLLFSNANGSLRRIVVRLLKKLDFHPHESGPRVQLSRREEVRRAEVLFTFRKYGRNHCQIV